MIVIDIMGTGEEERSDSDVRRKEEVLQRQKLEEEIRLRLPYVTPQLVPVEPTPKKR